MLKSARPRARFRSARTLLVPALLAALLTPAVPAANAFAATPPATASTSASPASAPAPAPAAAPQAEPVRRPASPVRADKAAAQAPAPAGSADEPCTPLALAPLGDPGSAVGSATIEPQGTACFEVVVTTPGLHRLLVSDQYASASLTSGGSQVACGDPSGSCELAAGTYTLSVYNSYWEPITNRVSLVPLMAAPECPAVSGTRYDSAPTTGSASNGLGIVCHAFTAAPGDRINADFQLTEYGNFVHWITDGTGKRICDSSECVLPAGVGGYRVLAEIRWQSGGFPAAYSLKVRRCRTPRAVCRSPRPRTAPRPRRPPRRPGAGPSPRP